MSDWFRRNRALYPDNWDEIAERIKALAGYRCAACSVPREACLSLGVHHLNGVPGDCTDTNLVSLCLKCHLRAHGLRPWPQSKAELIARLRRRFELELGQLCFPLIVPVFDPPREVTVGLFSVPLVSGHRPPEPVNPLVEAEQLELAGVAVSDSA